MKKILFKSGGMGFGGVERVQIEFINYLEQNPNYHFTFIIENDLGEGNVLLPNNVETVFLKTPALQANLQQAWQNKNKSLLHKIKYNLVIMKGRRIAKQIFNAVAKEFQPDIAINFYSNYGLPFGRLKDAKKIVWIHGGIVNVGRTHADGLRYLKRMNKYDKIVCVSKGIMKEAIELMPALANKITYLYNPQDFNKIKLLANEEFSEEEHQLAKEKFILMVSRVEMVQKDFKTLLNAFDIAKERGYDGKLYIIGEGNEYESKQLLDCINAVKYGKEIMWLGAKVNPFKWMQACDKFVLSSKVEGLPTVLTEALAVNDTVISSDCQWGPSEILGNDEYGYLFPVGDAGRLGELILTATGKPREKIDKHLQQFGHTAVFKRFEEILAGEGVI